ncbi:MAG: hypothetical protein WD070_05305 [Pirellulaceae bacterium]
MRQEISGNAPRRAGLEQQIERCVQFALRGASPNRPHDERRRQKRHPFPYPVRLLPVNAQGEIVGERIVVLGKHLTSQGFDFYFQHPVSYRRVIACFDCEFPARVELLMDLAWCRFSAHGWYENGGRFLSVVSPAASPTANERPASVVVQVESVVSGLGAVHA